MAYPRNINRIVHEVSDGSHFITITLFISATNLSVRVSV